MIDMLITVHAGYLLATMFAIASVFFAIGMWVGKDNPK